MGYQIAKCITFNSYFCPHNKWSVYYLFHLYLLNFVRYILLASNKGSQWFAQCLSSIPERKIFFPSVSVHLLEFCLQIGHSVWNAVHYNFDSFMASFIPFSHTDLYRTVTERWAYVLICIPGFSCLKI
jgi:hypothetical protein